jgi:NADH:ubiquinone reductase (H+-translocating)
MHTVIVGGGFAGVKAALELSKKQLGKITLISDVPYFLHHATLYQMASGRDVSASAVSLEDIFAKYHDVSLVKDRMTSVDFMQKEVICEKTRMPYDALIIAVGSVTDYFGTADEKKHSLGMAALEQVRQFKRHIHDDAASNRQADKAYAVIGGGSGQLSP